VIILLSFQRIKENTSITISIVPMVVKIYDIHILHEIHEPNLHSRLFFVFVFDLLASY